MNDFLVGLGTMTIADWAMHIMVIVGVVGFLILNSDDRGQSGR